MRIKKTSCLKFTILTGVIIFIVIGIRDTGNNEESSQEDDETIKNHKGNTSNLRSEDISIAERNKEKSPNFGDILQSSQAYEQSEHYESDAPDSLAGNRIHELPNASNSREDSQLIQSLDRQKSQQHPQNILEKIKEANKDQSSS
eukprot:GFUD01035245.1.p1 GENE.GFUD01035245.1~~GFUD01035245.1.p1  ORF type:complete len:145 (-),score=30.91 GFUD01035245.1:56-490(-)